MAAAARDRPVRADQGKRRAGVVIEVRGLPLRRAMTAGAAFHIGARRELVGVRIFMTPRAFFRRIAEVHVAQRRLQRPRAMAVQTGDAAVRAGQLKAGRRVVEPRQLSPSRGVMTRGAVGR